MRKHARLLVVGTGMLALALWLLVAGRSSRAAEENDMREPTLKMADAVQEKGLAAVKDAKELKEAELEDIMPGFSLRTKSAKNRALGMGPTPGAIQPDGIEKKLEELGKKELTKTQLTKEAKAIERAAYVAAGIGQLIIDKCPVAVKTGVKDPADWKKWSEDMAKQGLELAEAAKAGDAAAIKTKASNLDATCKACHSPFKD
jgi:cytochrome c'